jgi:hypothetical protein
MRRSERSLFERASMRENCCAYLNAVRHRHNFQVHFTSPTNQMRRAVVVLVVLHVHGKFFNPIFSFLPFSVRVSRARGSLADTLLCSTEQHCGSK